MRVAPPPAPVKQPTSEVRRRTLVSAKDVSNLLGVPVTSLYDLTRAGRIPGVVRIGHRIRYDLDVLNEWLDAGGHHKPDSQK